MDPCSTSGVAKVPGKFAFRSRVLVPCYAPGDARPFCGLTPSPVPSPVRSGQFRTFRKPRPPSTPQSTSGPKETTPLRDPCHSKARQPSPHRNQKNLPTHSRESNLRAPPIRKKMQVQVAVGLSCPRPLDLPESRCRASPADSLLRLDPPVNSVVPSLGKAIPPPGW